MEHDKRRKTEKALDEWRVTSHADIDTTRRAAEPAPVSAPAHFAAALEQNPSSCYVIVTRASVSSSFPLFAFRCANKTE